MFADWQVEGRENVPPMGPLIVAANHQSNFDPSLLASSLPRRTRFLAKNEIFSGPIITWFLRSYGTFPLNRVGSDIRAYRWALHQLKKDRALTIFPEGARSDGTLQKAMPGIVRLVLRSQAPILPVGITGTQGLGHIVRVLNPTGKLRVNIGPVFSLPSIEGRLSREILQSLIDMVMHRIAILLPHENQGVYRIRSESSPTGPGASQSGIEKTDFFRDNVQGDSVCESDRG